MVRRLLLLLLRSHSTRARRCGGLGRQSIRRLALSFQSIDLGTERRCELLLLRLLRKLLLTKVELAIVYAGVAAGILRNVERKMGGGVYWFVILWPVRHGHSPPICRYGATSREARIGLRGLIVDKCITLAYMSQIPDWREPIS